MVETTNNREPSPEEEIRRLEERLAQKRKELEERGETKEEKEAFREILRERIEEVRPRPNAMSTPYGTLPPSQAQVVPPAKVTDEDKRKLEALIEIAIGQSLVRAVHLAESISPYMLDLLHDTLVDKYYDRLIQSRQINRE